MDAIYERRLLQVARNRMVDESVVLLEGRRSVGKSTLLRQLAEAHDAEVIDLADMAVRQAVEANPALFASGPSPVCFDEYQKFPSVLDAVKAELNRRDAPGRFLMAGSTRHDALPITAQALTGRLNRLTVYPLTQTEIEGTGVNLVQTMFEEPETLIWRKTSTTSREDYIGRVADGGFPIALLADRVRQRTDGSTTTRSSPWNATPLNSRPSKELTSSLRYSDHWLGRRHKSSTSRRRLRKRDWT